MKKVTFRKLATEADSIKFLQSFHVVQQKYYICVPKFEEQTKEVHGTTYYQGTQKTDEFKEVKAVPFSIRINENLEMDCFLYKEKGAKTWIAWDALTGHSLAQLASTKEEAIKDASLKIELIVRKQGSHGMLNFLIDKLNTKGLSPRYEYDPGKLRVAAAKKPDKKPVPKSTQNDLNSRMIDLLSGMETIGKSYIPRVLWENQGAAATYGFTGKKGQDEYHGWELARQIKDKAISDAFFEDLLQTGKKYGFEVSYEINEKKDAFIVIKDFRNGLESFMAKFPVDEIFLKRQYLEGSLKSRFTPKSGPQYQDSILRNAYYDALRMGDTKTAEAILKKFPNVLPQSMGKKDEINRKVDRISNARRVVNQSKSGLWGRFADIQYRRGTGTKPKALSVLKTEAATDTLLPDGSYQFRYMSHLTPEFADHFVVYDSPVVVNSEPVAYAVIKRMKQNDRLVVRYYARSGKQVATDDFVKYQEHIAHTEVIFRGVNGNNTTAYVKGIIKKLWGAKRRPNKVRITTTVSRKKPLNNESVRLKVKVFSLINKLNSL